MKTVKCNIKIPKKVSKKNIMINCDKCKYKGSTIWEPELIINSDLLIVGPKPEGKDFCGEGYKFLKKYLTIFERKGILVSMTCALKCYTPKTPTKKELEICWPNLGKEIKITNPKLILILGKVALMAITKKNMKISNLVGKILYDYPTPIALSLHPSSVVGYSKSESKFEKGILPAIKFFEKQEELPYKIVDTCPPYKFKVGLDIETDSLNPYKGKIRSVSISEGNKALFMEIEDE